LFWVGWGGIENVNAIACTISVQAIAFVFEKNVSIYIYLFVLYHVWTRRWSSIQRWTSIL